MRKLLLLAALLAASVVHAQGSDSGAGTSGFKQLDKNGDGSVSAAEAAGDKEIAKRFKAFDANKDGKLSEEEYLKAANDNSKRTLADSTITTKIKGELLLAKGIPSTAISVETYEGRVQLSGFLENKEQIAKTVEIARSVSGVKAVDNGLKLK